ncbi:MAG TPA: hypothetical protein PKC43_08925 [Phycisphaerales bacterium]|nr:hypothetical protein [Phycisphaerales bacterium]HMP37559.1 hypothetical protein [Phycisphaerales bacterium]
MIFAAPAATLSWTPFVDPWPGAHDWWWITVIPLAVGIAMVYKAYRLPGLERYWRSVATMSMQIVLAMIAFATALALLALWIVPRLPAE